MKRAAGFDSASDPFGERTVCSFRTRAAILGGVFEFESNDPSLLQLVDSVYAGLPAHAFSVEPPHFRIRLLLSNTEGLPTYEEAPQVQLHAGAGVLCGIMDAANFAMVSPTQSMGLVAVTQSMLRHAHTVRYELIEFAVYTLASRAQQLVSLHAACVGRNERALLIIGESGAGKTTVALHCLLQNMELVAEDAVLVKPDSLLATGVGSFLHLRADSLEFLRHASDDVWIRSSPVIRRRSGVEKFEADVRRGPYRIAQQPLKIAGVVFPSSEHAFERPLLAPLRKSDFLERLEASQPYAANQPAWSTFLEQISSIPAFELRRGQHPSDAVDALREIS